MLMPSNEMFRLLNLSEDEIKKEAQEIRENMLKRFSFLAEKKSIQELDESESAQFKFLDEAINRFEE